MTDYELTNLFFTAVQTGDGTMTNYMTLVFGMIVSSYLAAHRIDRVMMWIALAIYSLFALGFCNGIFQAYSDFSRIGLVLTERGKLPGNDLGWFGPVVNGTGAVKFVPPTVGIMVYGAYIGSIAFFFRARRANLAKGIGPVEPGDTADA